MSAPSLVELARSVDNLWCLVVVCILLLALVGFLRPAPVVDRLRFVSRTRCACGADIDLFTADGLRPVRHTRRHYGACFDAPLGSVLADPTTGATTHFIDPAEKEN